MPGSLASTLSKVLLPVLGIAAMLFAARRRGMSLADDIGLRKPRWIPAAGFLVAWLVLIAAEEWVLRSIGGVEVKVWPNYATVSLILRILAIGVLGPIAEELAFRGLLMAWLSRSRFGVYGAIVVCAALWSVIHAQYAPVFLAIIFIDGIVLGLARNFTRSIYIPMAMHMVGNLFSIYQSLSP